MTASSPSPGSNTLDGRETSTEIPILTNETPEADSRPQRTPTFGDYFRVFTYATKWDFCVYAIASVASIGAGITMPLMNIVFGQLVGQFTDYFRDSSTMSPDVFKSILNKQALYIMALFLGRWTLNTINKYCFRMIGIRLSSAIRLHYIRSLFAQSIHAIDSMPAGAPATAITSTSNTLQVGVSERLGTFLEYNGTSWASLIIAFVWSWDLTLVTSSLVLYIIFVLAVTLPLIVKGQTATAAADAGGTAVASEALERIRLVMACGAQSRIVARYREWVQKAMKEGHKLAPAAGLQFGLVFFGIFGAFGLAFWYGTQRYAAGAMESPAPVIIVLMCVMLVLTAIERISTPLMAVSKAMIAACEFFVVIDAPLPVSGDLKLDITTEDILFDNVTFEYPSRPGVRILDGLNLRIQSGKNTALVGPSGSGKSTVVGLLERWYSLSNHQVLPQVIEATKEKKGEEKESQENEKQEGLVNLTMGGTVTVGGNNLEELDLKWWRAQIGLVQQEPFLFNDTIFKNVANGLVGTEFEDAPEEKKRELVKEACQEAYADEFINRLPDGYDTKVGDGGAKMSGGQKQRLAIARSIIKKPQLIILDEATSAIDAKSEKIVQAALDRITQNRTSITIAHRLSTIKKADHIIVLQRGRAVEKGTHSSLMMDKSGVYSALVQAQSLRFGDKQEGETPLVSDAESEKIPNEDEVNKVVYAPEVSQTAEPVQRRGLIGSFGRLLLEQRGQWPLYIGIVLSAMAVAAGTPLQAWLFAKVLGVFLLEGGDIDRESNFWGLMWFALAGGVGLSYFFEGWIGLRVQYCVSACYKAQYLNDMLHQQLAYFDDDDNSHGSLSSRISGDAKQLEELLGMNLAFLISSIFNVTGCVIISLIFGWKLGLMAMFVALPVMLGAGFWKFRHEVQFDKMNSAVFMESSQFATEAIGAIRTVSSLTMEDSINNRYHELLNGHVKAANSKARWTSAVFGFADSAGLGCQALIFWYGGGLLAKGEYSMEAFMVCFIAIIQGAEAASYGFAMAPNAAQVTAAANRILDVHQSAHVQGSHVSGQKGGITDTEGGVKIELRNASFKYPTRDVPVFDSLSLTIEKGQYAAFVGPSGCGKTTIISLLERFYDLEPNKGALLCNGTNINDLDIYEYRDNLSLVPQEPTMFRGTIRDNILFGIADPSTISQERIHEVCRDAFIHDFIVSLPEGYNTDVGNRGVSMSGGQKQRIAIARALIRDPKILLLDEATSALDSESEKIVQAAFEKARKGRTMIAVAHRLATIQNADVIFVFDQGRVVEKGTHEELIAKEGVYYEMCQSQALDQ